MYPRRIALYLHDPPSECPACEWSQIRAGDDHAYLCRLCGHQWTPVLPPDAPEVCSRCEVNWYVQPAERPRYAWRCHTCERQWGKGPDVPRMIWCPPCQDYHYPYQLEDSEPHFWEP
ncbi:MULTISPECIES: hypothetical protein [Actinosynnema]|uniref:hypothetical protein n=1 Tax=Actinosynnema TaxID=40566 RepID=UPI0020A3F19A|nr:hypothetical protein [Actinosynnema pretiosum]MCP2093066.1 hypothetical protein [Actinosynnema pretiosum]